MDVLASSNEVCDAHPVIYDHQRMCLATLSVIEFGGGSQLDALFASNVLEVAIPLLDSSRDVIVMQVCRLLGNIAFGGTLAQRQQMMDFGILPKIVTVSFARFMRVCAVASTFQL